MPPPPADDTPTPSEDRKGADDAELDPTVGLPGGVDDTQGPESEVDPTLVLSGDPDAPLATDPSPPLPVGAQLASAGTGAGAQVFANRFEVVQLLGEGGMGRVYRVRDRQIEGREVALKVLRPRFSRNPRFRELFFQEIRAAQKFVSEHVNQVRDTGQMDDGRLFLTMDLVDGESLHEVLRREGQLNTRHALEIARQMLLGLASGHEQGFVHRDVKPSNVMLAARVSKTDENPFGVGVRLLDFGIAALGAELVEGSVSGTPTYMSPEQAQGQRLDARSDLFSVGIVLYEMLTGGRPFAGATLEEVSAALVETKVATLVKSLDHLRPGVQRILQRALEKDREKRFQSAAEFAEAIERSKAYRLPTGVPGWVGALLAVSVVAAAGEGWVIASQFKELSGVRADATADKEREIRFVEDSWSKRLSEKESIIAARDARIGELEVDLRAKGDADTLADATEQDMELRVRALEDQRDQERIERRRLEQELLSEREKRERLELKVRQQERVSQPTAQAALGTDMILEFIENGHGRDALAHLEQLEANRLFSHTGIGGNRFLRELAGTAARLEDWSRSRGRESLEQALAHARAAQAELPAFEIGSKEWIGFVSDSSTAEPPNRMARAEAALSSLRGTVDAELGRVRSADLERAKDIVEGPPDQDPDPVIAQGEAYGWDALAPFLDRLVAHELRADVGGSLDLAALRKDRVLPRWGAYADAHRKELGSAVADPLRWLWFARRWYVDRSADGFAPALGELALDEGEPDWRAVLALQFELAQRFGRSLERPRTYVDRQLRAGSTAWIVELSAGREATAAGGSVWTLRRRILTERGGGDLDQFEDKLKLTFENGELVGNDGRRVLDVRDPRAAVERWTPPAGLAIPRNRSLPRQDDVDAFGAERREDPVWCLVVEDPSTDTVRWVSPDLGIVREERKGVYVLELVHVDD